MIVTNKYNLALLALFICIAITYAQESPKLAMTSYVKKDSILLRWGPTDALTWETGNVNGYILERYTILRDTTIVSPVVGKQLGGVFKPLPLAMWEPLVKKNESAAIVAQALYGEDFNVSPAGEGDGFFAAVEQSREREMRFSFALYGADQSWEIAVGSGLGYVDKDVKENEQYLYKVYMVDPENTYNIDTAFVLLGLGDYRPLPQPVYLEGQFLDHHVMFSWNGELLKSIYNAYQIERATDSLGPYEAINDLPIINTRKDDQLDNPLRIYADSLPENYKTYYYRLRGINAFGDMGPPSDTISGMGRDDLSTPPEITSADIVEGGEGIELKWTFSDEQTKHIEGFRVWAATKGGSRAKFYPKGDLSPDVRNFIDTLPMGNSNYYKVEVYDSFDQRVMSSTSFVQLDDSIPPLVPTALAADIDTNGVVRLRWATNVEPDLLGYRIYRKKNIEDDFLIISPQKPLTDTTYTDSISIRTLTGDIYYAIDALDKRFNPSSISPHLRVRIPDMIPPTTPILYNGENVSRGIRLEWQNSGSTDVRYHALYRRDAQQPWMRIAVFEAKDNIEYYLDQKTDKGIFYQYTISAIDSSGLVSPPAHAFEIRRLDDGVRPAIEAFEGEVNDYDEHILLEWQYGEAGVSKYIIYRAVDAEQLEMYTSVEDAQTFIDDAVKRGKRYTYRVIAVFDNGARSSMSTDVALDY